LNVEIFNAGLDGEGLRVGLVQARFNEPICDALREACLAELKALGVADDDVFVCSVPGALEIPVALRQLASSAEFDALVALGAVVRGETYHFEVVSNQSAHGVLQVSLDYGLPVANAILTVDTDEQAHARMRVKGAEAARVAVEMANLAASLATLKGDDDGE
jgi:6,7-dimethyl-8-ribityllumazine synthase